MCAKKGRSRVGTLLKVDEMAPSSTSSSLLYIYIYREPFIGKVDDDG